MIIIITIVCKKIKVSSNSSLIHIKERTSIIKEDLLSIEVTSVVLLTLYTSLVSSSMAMIIIHHVAILNVIISFLLIPVLLELLLGIHHGISHIIIHKLVVYLIVVVVEIGHHVVPIKRIKLVIILKVFSWVHSEYFVCFT